RHTRFSRDWSSDVCSSDLVFHKMRPRGGPGTVMPDYNDINRPQARRHNGLLLRHTGIAQKQGAVSGTSNFQHTADGILIFLTAKIGRASCRERAYTAVRSG